MGFWDKDQGPARAWPGRRWCQLLLGLEGVSCELGCSRRRGLCLTPTPLENQRRPRAERRHLLAQPPLPFQGSLGWGAGVPAWILSGLVAPHPTRGSQCHPPPYQQFADSALTNSRTMTLREVPASDLIAPQLCCRMCPLLPPRCRCLVRGDGLEVLICGVRGWE